MKTPREILLDRHRAAKPKLDAIRKHVLRPSEPTAFGDRLLREFLLPLRWHFAGMSAAWLLVVVLNVDHASPAVMAASDSRSAPRQLLIALVENRRQLVEMMDPAAEVPGAAQPWIPRRRSEAQPACAVV